MCGLILERNKKEKKTRGRGLVIYNESEQTLANVLPAKVLT